MKLFTLITFLTTAPAHAAVEWQPIEKSASISGITVAGRVVPQDGALNIESARVPGRALAILKREGERVGVGTELFEISSGECFQLMEEKRVAAAKKLDDLVAGVARREKQLGLKLSGDKCFAVANHDGILTKRNVESGASFNSGDALATVLDTRRMTVEFDVPERDQPHVRVDQKTTFQFASNSDQTFTGRVLNVVPTIDPVTRTSKIRVKVDQAFA